MKTLMMLAAFFPLSILAADAKPKYGPEATVLSESHQYFRAHEAPDFWALIPYYVPQQDERSCSVASVAMVMNGVRVGTKLGSEDELVTQAGLLKKVADEKWQKDVGSLGHGVTLDELGKFVEESLKAYGYKGTVEVEHADNSPKFAAKLHEALVANEKSRRDFLIANFLQGVYTGDAEAGHIAPVGAYDATTKRVLILDPDRQWYEPYWVSEKTFLAGMATPDKESGKSRGYVRVQVTK